MNDSFVRTEPPASTSTAKWSSARGSHFQLICAGLLGVLWASSSAAEEGAAAPAPTPTPVDAGVTSRSGQPLGAQHAVRLALRNSPTLSVASIERTRTKYGVSGEEGRYQFVFQADAGYTQTATPRLQAGDAVNANTLKQFVVGAQMTRKFSTGTTGVLRLQGERNDYEFQFVNPLVPQTGGYAASARLTLTQPLLRGFGTDVGLVELHAAEVVRTRAEKSERRVASQLVRDVLTAYWELWYAGQAVEIQHQSLVLAVDQQRDAEARVAKGALAPADALTFETRVAELEEAVVEAEANERSRALELLRLTGAAGTSEGREDWQAGEAPEDLSTPSRADVTRAAADDSIELAELDAQVKEAQVRAEVAGDELRSRLDVDGWVESRGVGTTPDSTIGRAWGFAYVSGHVGLTFELPTDNSQKVAARQTALLAVSTAKANLAAARDRVTTQAATAVTSAEAAERRLALAQRTRDIAQRTLSAAQGRYRLGLAIPLQVQEADEQVRQARLREARARVDLATQQAALHHLSGGLLQRYASNGG
ncbi:MAG TPA: TolC family protein [Polyangiaceae bacterium]|nr:TolC family protein [Polyangiaceae bacterium]